jgi:hypothetical protein
LQKAQGREFLRGAASAALIGHNSRQWNIGARREGFVKSGVVTVAALTVIVLASATAPGPAQAPQTLPPLPGFVPPYEITQIVRSAGFDPLAPPLRQGGTYVVRATDFRGTLMRVVIDGRSGAIRAVNRIVAASEAYGPAEILPPAYALPQAYGEPAPPEPPRMVPFEQSAAPAPPPAAPLLAPSPAAHPVGFPPLPRPRPAKLASRKAAGDSKPAVGEPAAASSAPDTAVPKKQLAPAPLPD